MALVLALLLTGEPEYQSRVGLVAIPVATGNPADPEYGAVVSSIMPALPEMAVSTSVVDRLARELPGVDVTTLAESVAVELVPASGVARVTATGGSPEAAAAVLRAVVDEIVDSNLLAPVGRFTVLGDVDAEVTQVGPDSLLAGGLGVLAAVVVGLIAVAAVQVLRPRLLTVDDVEDVVRSVVDSGVPVLALGRHQRGLDVLAARLAALAPEATQVRGFPAGAGAQDGVVQAIDERLAGRALNRATPPSAPGQDPAGAARRNGRAVTEARHLVPQAVPLEPAVVIVQLRRTTSEELAAALLAAIESGNEIGAVVVR